MNISKSKIKNIIFIIVLAILIIPQTRKPIQVLIQKGFALISPSIENNNKIKTLTNYNWTLRDKDNNVLNLQELKGKVILINFWATWCPPCIAEMPSLQKLYNDYNDKVVFLFVTTDWFNTIKSFLDKNKYTFKVYRPDENGYPEFLNINTIPRTFLIDKEGNIIIDESDAANWNSEIVRNTIDNLLK
jgi:thiol-disulfide isomerase/thioredoxin